jgi:hypothetical protein
MSKELREAQRLAAWLKAYAKFMPLPPEENMMHRAGRVLSDLYLQNKILRDLLDMDRKVPHDARREKTPVSRS